MSSSPIVVLDTNVLLDWMVFRDRRCDAVTQAIEAGRLRWHATPAMRDELMHVLRRGALAGWQPDEPSLWACWDRLATMVAPPPPGAHRLRCTDTDDQKFLDLALAGAQWLLSRDRALLKLARRAAPFGLRVAPPEHWQEKRVAEATL